jgi:hypothetical protein
MQTKALASSVQDIQELWPVVNFPNKTLQIHKNDEIIPKCTKPNLPTVLCSTSIVSLGWNYSSEALRQTDPQSREQQYSRTSFNCMKPKGQIWPSLIRNVSKSVKINFIIYISFNPFEPSDAMWRRTFHLSLICVSFAH